jgi:hypothetical protein
MKKRIYTALNLNTYGGFIENKIADNEKYLQMIYGSKHYELQFKNFFNRI